MSCTCIATRATTIASGASLNATLHAMHADTVDMHRVGAQWLERMGWTNDRAMATRDGWADDAARVTDIGFDDAVADPIGQVARVYDAVGLPLTAEADRKRCGTGWPERPREAAPAGLRLGDLRPAPTSRSTSDSRCTTSVFDSSRHEEQRDAEDPVATSPSTNRNWPPSS